MGFDAINQKTEDSFALSFRIVCICWSITGLSIAWNFLFS